MNAASVLLKPVVSIPGQKVLIGEYQQIRSFLTEGPNGLFTLEAFLPSVEARAYSQGKLRAVGDIINLSYWDRSMLYELQCTAM